MEPAAPTTECLCHEISAELVDVVTWLSEGDLSPEEFLNTVHDLERRKLQRHGFRLASAVGENGIVHFALRFADTDELCASLDVDPQSGAVEIQRTCGSVHSTTADYRDANSGESAQE